MSLSDAGIPTIVDTTQNRTDVYEWLAEYEDGETLPEYEADGTQHGWKDIDQTRLARFILIPQRRRLPAHALVLTGDSRPIFFRRRQVDLDMNTDEVQERRTITVLGFQRTVGGRNVSSYTAFYEDGSVLVTDDHATF